MQERTANTNGHKLRKVFDKVTHPGTQDLHRLSLYAAPLALGTLSGVGLFGLNYFLYREGITPYACLKDFVLFLPLGVQVSKKKIML